MAITDYDDNNNNNDDDDDNDDDIDNNGNDNHNYSFEGHRRGASITFQGYTVQTRSLSRGCQIPHIIFVFS